MINFWGAVRSTGGEVAGVLAYMVFEDVRRWAAHILPSSFELADLPEYMDGDWTESGSWTWRVAEHVLFASIVFTAHKYQGGDNTQTRTVRLCGASERMLIRGFGA